MGEAIGQDERRDSEIRERGMSKRHQCARIVAAIASGHRQAEQIAVATGVALKSVQNRLGELRNAGVLQVTGKIAPADSVDGQFPNPHGRSWIEWGIAA